MSPDEKFPIFFGTWVILAVFSFAIFYLGKNAKLKRKLWPPFVIVTGVLFIGFTYAMGFAGQALYVIIPAMVFMTFLNLKSLNFCDACGTTIIKQIFQAKPEFCSKCGEKLQ